MYHEHWIRIETQYRTELLSVAPRVVRVRTHRRRPIAHMLDWWRGRTHQSAVREQVATLCADAVGTPPSTNAMGCVR